MKRRLLSTKELAHELGVHEDTIYRAHLENLIPVRRVRKVLRFDLEKVLEALDKQPGTTRGGSKLQRATAGSSRRRARTISPRLVKRGRNFQGKTRR